MPNVYVRGKGLVHFDDSLGEEDIVQRIRKIEAADSAASAPPQTMMPSDPLALRERLTRLSAAVPPLASAVGGLARRTPAGMGIAGLAGAGAELGREALLGEDINPLRIAGEGVKGALFEFGGRGLAGAASRFGQQLIPRALGASRGARAEMGDIAARTGSLRLGEGLGPAGERELVEAVTAGNLRSSAAAKAAREAADTEARALINMAERSGVRISLDEIAQHAIEAEKAAAGGRLSWSQTQAVRNRVRDKLKDMLGAERMATTVNVGKSLSPSRADRARRVSQRLSKGARKMASEGKIKLGDEQLLQSISVGTREALENAVGGLKDARTTTARMGRAERALSDMEMLRSGVTMHLGGPFRAAGIATPAINLTRQQALGLGLDLGRPTAQRVARQAPRVLDALAEPFMFPYEDPDQTQEVP